MNIEFESKVSAIRALIANPNDYQPWRVAAANENLKSLLSAFADLRAQLDAKNKDIDEANGVIGRLKTERQTWIAERYRLTKDLDAAKAACAVKDEALRYARPLLDDVGELEVGEPGGPCAPNRAFVAKLLFAQALSSTCGQDLLAERDRLTAELARVKYRWDSETCDKCNYMRSPVSPCKCGQSVRIGTNDRLRAELAEARGDKERLKIACATLRTELLVCRERDADRRAAIDRTLSNTCDVVIYERNN